MSLLQGSTDKSVHDLEAESPLFLEKVDSSVSSKPSSAGSKRKVQPKKREGFGAVWASRSEFCVLYVSMSRSGKSHFGTVGSQLFIAHCFFDHVLTASSVHDI